jgi:hypothetical protein
VANSYHHNLVRVWDILLLFRERTKRFILVIGKVSTTLLVVSLRPWLPLISVIAFKGQSVSLHLTPVCPMFKYRSIDRPSTPKLSSVALPTSPALRTHPLTSRYPHKPTKLRSFIGHLRSTFSCSERVEMVGWPYSQAQGQYWIPSQYDTRRAPEALVRSHSVKRVDDGEGASCFVTALIRMSRLSLDASAAPATERTRNYKPPRGVLTHGTLLSPLSGRHRLIGGPSGQSKAAREDVAERALDEEKASARRRMDELEGLEPIPLNPRRADGRRDREWLIAEWSERLISPSPNSYCSVEILPQKAFAYTIAAANTNARTSYVLLCCQNWFVY